jgi:G:T-mismatch repair DNA endonuclease (very short patch repair protein)
VKRILNRNGWSYLTVWQCQLNDFDKITQRIRAFLDK